MYNITLFSSFHMERGKCNSSELYKIIEKLQPEIIFEELPYDIFNLIYFAGQIPKSIEAITIKGYLKTYKINHIPVDTLEKNLEDYFQGYDVIANKNPEYLELCKQHFAMVAEYGYTYINSNDHADLLEQIQLLEENTLSEINNPKLIYQYNLSKELHDKRDVEMLQNIYNHSKQHLYNNGLFICGAEHRKSIILKILEFEKKEKIKLNWTFYNA